MKCLLCGSLELKRVNKEYKYDTKEFREYFPNLEIMKCSNCDLVQVSIDNSTENDRKLFRYYSKIYRDNEMPPKLEDKGTVLYWRGYGISRLIKKYCNHKKLTIFEKGSGYGYNLMKIHEVFPDAVLYTDEMDEHTEQYLKRIGIKKYVPNERKYDIIIISHVLEHLLNPLETISEAYSILEDDGLLYIEVPNSMNYAEPHITFWNMESLKNIYKSYLKDKFTLLECYTTGYPRYYRSPFSKVFYEFEKRIIPDVKMVNKRTCNGVYLRALLKKEKAYKS